MKKIRYNTSEERNEILNNLTEQEYLLEEKNIIENGENVNELIIGTSEDRTQEYKTNHKPSVEERISALEMALLDLL